MLTFGLAYDVIPARTDEFEKTTASVLELVQGLPGHLETRLYHDVFKPNSYLIYSDWETREDFTAFLKSDAFAAAQNLGREMLETQPRHHVYERAAFEMRPSSGRPAETH